MGASKHTPGPWSYVAGTEHHGPYVTSEFGSDICDCYTMSRPDLPSALNGGPSHPIPFLAEMAEPNARLIAAAPDLLDALKRLLQFIREHTEAGEVIPPHTVEHEHAMAIIAKAEGRS